MKTTKSDIEKDEQFNKDRESGIRFPMDIFRIVLLKKCYMMEKYMV